MPDLTRRPRDRFKADSGPDAPADLSFHATPYDRDRAASAGGGRPERRRNAAGDGGQRGTGTGATGAAGSDLLAGLTSQSVSTEFYSPMPEGYRRGRHKYVAVFGTVMSGLGKGIFASSLAKLLKDKGLVVAPMKLEGYLNSDAGTLNPYRHGEVFVLDDGTER